MAPRSGLILLRKLSALIVVLALVAVACSSGSGVVATVGATDLTEADIGDFFESDTLPIDESLREAIFALLAREILLQGLGADFDLELDQTEVDSVYGDLIAQMEEAAMTPEDFLGVPDASVAMVRFNAEIGVIREQVVEGLIQQPETIEAFFSEPVAYTTVCVRHVLVATTEEAEDVLARLDGGEDFAAVATEVSLDTGTPGGDLGCSPAGRYVPEFAQASVTADIGALTGPIETDFGFHLLVVDERTAPTEEEVKADPQAHLTDADVNAIWTEWFNETLQTAEVTLDEKYGFWSSVGIIPPDRPDLVPTEE